MSGRPEDRVELITLGGEEYLFYKALPLDVAFLRGTTAIPGETSPWSARR